jgi:hypothetical protein
VELTLQESPKLSPPALITQESMRYFHVSAYYQAFFC